MASEDAAGVAAIEDVAELRRLLAAAQQTAKVSLARANQHAGELTRWRGKRDELAMAVREALGMSGTPARFHMAPILARIAEVRADRDDSVSVAGQLRRAATLRDRTLADMTEEVDALRLAVAEREPEVSGLRERLAVAREALDAERARSVALERDVRAARAEVAHNARRVRVLEISRANVVKASAEAEAERIKAAQQRDRAVQAETHVAELQEKAAAQRQAIEELRQESAGMQTHVRAMQAALQSANRKIEELTLVPPSADDRRAPRQPLLDHMLAGPRSVTVHRARLADWVRGEGHDVEAARWLASVTRDERAPPEQRARAGVALSGLLGGVR